MGLVAFASGKGAIGEANIAIMIMISRILFEFRNGLENMLRTHPT